MSSKKKKIDINITIDENGNINVDYTLNNNIEVNISVNNVETYNSEIRKRFTIPIGNLSTEEANKSLQKFLNECKTPIKFNDNVYITVNGSKHKRLLPSSKEIWLQTPGE